MRSYFAGSNCAGMWLGSKLPRSGITKTVPDWRKAFSQSERPFKSWRFRIVTIVAPKIAPGIEPMPPKITIASTPIDSMKVKLSGLTKPCFAEKSTPMAAANDAPTANARSFMRTTGTPMATAAISSSRIAFHARPIGEFSSRRVTKTIARSRASTRK